MSSQEPVLKQIQLIKAMWGPEKTPRKATKKKTGSFSKKAWVFGIHSPQHFYFEKSNVRCFEKFVFGGFRVAFLGKQEHLRAPLWMLMCGPWRFREAQQVPTTSFHERHDCLNPRHDFRSLQGEEKLLVEEQLHKLRLKGNILHHSFCFQKKTIMSVAVWQQIGKSPFSGCQKGYVLY